MAAEPAQNSDQRKHRGCSNKAGNNLVVCIDGTSNEFGNNITNVLELYRLAGKGTSDEQFTYYHSGIGTYAQSLRPGIMKSLVYGTLKVFVRPIDLALACLNESRNFEDTILDAYHWLSEKYEEGDRIFLFGFSRGAYQVRTLSAMINKVGLIHASNQWQIPMAYQLYVDPMSEHSEAPTFKSRFSREVRVHFVGAWDTVSSVGIRGDTLLPETIEGMKHVCFFRHALALDERRVKFLPEYAHGGISQPSTETVESDHTKEVWFVGTHSDIGGGGLNNDHGPAFKWMLSEACSKGLRLNNSHLSFEDAKIKESLTWTWQFLEYLPVRRLTYATEDGKGNETTYRFHCGAGRIIQKGQRIHSSVFNYLNATGTEYTPCALLPFDAGFWKKPRSEDYLAENTEIDPWAESNPSLTTVTVVADRSVAPTFARA